MNEESALDAAEVGRRLHTLFEAAKGADEFDFACTLLRVRGMQSEGWDPFEETSRLVNDLVGLIEAPLDGHTRARLGLLLYSHLTEVDAVYAVVANLANITQGERYSLAPFDDLVVTTRRGERLQPSATRVVKHLATLLRGAGYAPVAELLDWFFEPAIRNAFAHAAYTLHGDVFRAPGEGFRVGNVTTSEMPVAQLGDKLNRALTFYDRFVQELAAQRMAYTENRVVSGCIAGPEPVPVELLAHEQGGLYGFRSPPEAPTVE